MFINYVVCTGQHDDMVLSVLSIFEITPDRWFSLRDKKKHHTLQSMTAQIQLDMADTIEDLNPDYVIVQGDTISAMTSAVAAFYSKVKVIHIEAGLRSFNMSEPFPEEFNRKNISSIADFNFTTTHKAYRNLRDEKIDPSKCFYVGNTLVDAYQIITNKRNIQRKKKYIIVTCHRRENWEKPLKELCKFLKTLKKEKVIFFTHPNPITYNQVINTLKDTPIEIKISVSYIKFVEYMAHAKIIITDSGGIQEEASFLGISTLVYRNVTERPEGLEGPLILVGNCTKTLGTCMEKLLYDEEFYDSKEKRITCYGDGDTSKKIVETIRRIEIEKEKQP